MPTYQYACTVCGHQLEAVQSFSDAPLAVCPECDGRLRKVFNSVGIVFKGSGFYRTDSRSGSSPSGAAPSGGAPSSAGSSEGSSTKSETGSSGKSDSSSGSTSTSSSSTSGASSAAKTSG